MSNKKTKWSSENETTLLKLISENVNIDKISKKLKKTEKDIIHKLKKIALRMTNNNKTKEEIANTLKFLTEKQISKIIEYNKKKSKLIVNNTNSNSAEFSEFGFEKYNRNKINNNNNNTNTNIKEFEKFYTLLSEINTKLDILINNKTANIKNMTQHNQSSSESEATETTKNTKNTKNTKVNNKEIKKDTKNGNESSSYISSGNDDIIGLIQNRTTEINAIKTKYLNSLKK